MLKNLINPFKHIAGWNSLIAGFIIILLTALVCSLSGVYFPDIISVKLGLGFNYPFWKQLLIGSINWLTVATIFYIAGLIFARTSVRWVDVFGTQALARLPYFFVSFTGFFGGLDRYGEYLRSKYIDGQVAEDLSTLTIIFSWLVILLTILLSIWLVILMYQAFKVSTNLKGSKLTWIFIVSLVLSCICSNYLSSFLIK